MSELTPQVVDILEEAIDGKIQSTVGKPAESTHQAQVASISNDGVIWVRLLGADEDTPVVESFAAVKAGEWVSVKIENGRATIIGNYTEPAVGATESTVIAKRMVKNPDINPAIAKSNKAQELAEEADRVIRAVDQHFWTSDNGAFVTEMPKDDYLTAFGGQFPDWDPSAKPYFAHILTSTGELLRTGPYNLASFTHSGAAFYDGNGNEAENILASFGLGGGMILGGKVETSYVTKAISTLETGENYIKIPDKFKLRDFASFNIYAYNFSSIYTSDGSLSTEFLLENDAGETRSILFPGAFKDWPTNQSDIDRDVVSILNDGRVQVDYFCGIIKFSDLDWSSLHKPFENKLYIWAIDWYDDRLPFEIDYNCDEIYTHNCYLRLDETNPNNLGRVIHESPNGVLVYDLERDGMIDHVNHKLYIFDSTQRFDSVEEARAYFSSSSLGAYIGFKRVQPERKYLDPIDLSFLRSNQKITATVGYPGNSNIIVGKPRLYFSYGEDIVTRTDISRLNITGDGLNMELEDDGTLTNIFDIFGDFQNVDFYENFILPDGAVTYTENVIEIKLQRAPIIEVTNVQVVHGTLVTTNPEFDLNAGIVRFVGDDAAFLYDIPNVRVNISYIDRVGVANITLGSRTGNVGRSSAVFGEDCTASNVGTAAFGIGTKAESPGAFAIGMHNANRSTNGVSVFSIGHGSPDNPLDVFTVSDQGYVDLHEDGKLCWRPLSAEGWEGLFQIGMDYDLGSDHHWGLTVQVTEPNGNTTNHIAEFRDVGSFHIFGSLQPLNGQRSGVPYIGGAIGQNALIYQPHNYQQAAWTPLLTQRTYGHGAWQIGNYNNENLEFVYANKTNIDNQTNTVDKYGLTPTNGVYQNVLNTGRIWTQKQTQSRIATDGSVSFTNNSYNGFYIVDNNESIEGCFEQGITRSADGTHVYHFVQAYSREYTAYGGSYGVKANAIGAGWDNGNPYYILTYPDAFISKLGLGTIINKDGAATNVKTSKATNLASINLTAGKWLVMGGFNIAGNSSGLRKVALSTTSADTANARGRTIRFAPPSTSAALMTVGWIFSGNQTVYAVCTQSSGSTLSCSCYMTAIRIG